MERYLLFDTTCDTCSRTAETVESISGGWLRARSLRDPEIVELLDRNIPGWSYRPMLMEVNGAAIRVKAGLGMSLALLRGLGPSRSRQVLTAVAEKLAPDPGIGRRSVLVGAGALGLVALGMTVRSSPAIAGAGGAVVLSGSALADATARAHAAPEIAEARDLLTAEQYDTEQEQVVAISDEAGSTLLMLFYPHRTRSVSDAAIISCELDDPNSKPIVERISADRNEMFAGDRLQPEALTVTALGDGKIRPQGAGQYFTCIAGCVGVNCAVKASRCRYLGHLAAVLACMAAVCGPKVRTCHRVCKSKW